MRLAEFNIEVMRQIGATPQVQLLKYVMSLSDQKLLEWSEPLMKVLGQFLSAEIEITAWNGDTLSISFSPIEAAEQIRLLREDSIGVLKKIYHLQQDHNAKRETLGTLFSATNHYSRIQLSPESVTMISDNTIEILEFLKELIPTEDLSIVQKIEHDAYWIFIRSLDEQVEYHARQIYEEISQHNEYQIYRDLIGYDSVFGEWTRERGNEDGFREIEAQRKARALEYAGTVRSENFGEWRERLLVYCQEESNDLAYFTFLYSFLDEVCKSNPDLLLLLLSENHAEIGPIRIALLRDLWSSRMKDSLISLLNVWIDEGLYLVEMTHMFMNNESVDFEFLARVRDKAIDDSDVFALKTLITVTASNYPEHKPKEFSEFFLNPIRALGQLGNADWARGIWYSLEIRKIVAEFDEDEVLEILNNLLNLQEVNHQSDRILTAIAHLHPVHVVRYFKNRLDLKYVDGRKDYQGIPFDLHDLKVPLSEAASAVVPEIRQWYNGDYTEFSYKGADLPHIIFPKFEKAFQDELMLILENRQYEDLEFVVVVLAQYSGEPFLYEFCRKMIEMFELDDRLSDYIYYALRNTPVVSGVYGFAEAYEAKVVLVRPWSEDRSARVRAFASMFIERTQKNAEQERERADVEVAYRKLKYGE